VSADPREVQCRCGAWRLDDEGCSWCGQPPVEYGRWERGNAGQVGRTVTRWIPGIIATGWIPAVGWEPHPDEIPTAEAGAAHDTGRPGVDRCEGMPAPRQPGMHRPPGMGHRSQVLIAVACVLTLAVIAFFVVTFVQGIEAGA